MNDKEEDPIVIDTVIMPVIEDTSHPHCAWFECTKETKEYFFGIDIDLNEEVRSAGWFCDEHWKERIELEELYEEAEQVNVIVSKNFQIYRQEDLN